MVTVFYKANGSIVNEIDEDLLRQIDYEDLLWIDLVNPTEKQSETVEDFFGISLQTRQQAEEIESSSRYSETENLIIANSSFLLQKDESFVAEPTSCILKDGILISHRNVELRSFGDTMRKLSYNPKAYPTGYHILIALFETRIDLDADMLEYTAKQISILGGQVSSFNKEDVYEEVIVRINTLQENTMQVRENIIDKQRILSGVQKSERFPNDLYPKLQVMINDTSSLVNHADFSFDRLEYLQDTFLGLANIKLNRITKTFTIVSVLFMPATLIASLYGMNFRLMPELEWDYGYAFAVGLMLASSLITLLFFRLKKLL